MKSRQSGQSGQSGQNKVNNTTISLHLSRSLYCLLVASRATLRVIHSSYFRISVTFGLQENLPPTTWQAANASIASGSHLQPAKSPNLSERPILFLSWALPYRGSSRRPADGRQLMQPNIRRPISTCLPDTLGAHPNALE